MQKTKKSGRKKKESGFFLGVEFDEGRGAATFLTVWKQVERKVLEDRRRQDHNIWSIVWLV